MSVSILETLLNADYNINKNEFTALSVARSQLHNAVVLLEKGYSIYTEVEPLLSKYGSVEDVPDFDEDE